MKKRSVRWLVIALFALFLGACGQKSSQVNSKEAKGMKIVTSFYPVYAMVKEISGDLNDVRMIQSSSGIHSFEPSANDIAAIYDADVFVYHSHTLESWAGSLDPSLQKSKVKVLEASEGMTLERVPGLEDMQAGEGIDEKTLYDPHTWIKPSVGLTRRPCTILTLGLILKKLLKKHRLSLISYPNWTVPTRMFIRKTHKVLVPKLMI